MSKRKPKTKPPIRVAVAWVKGATKDAVTFAPPKFEVESLDISHSAEVIDLVDDAGTAIDKFYTGEETWIFTIKGKRL